MRVHNIFLVGPNIGGVQILYDSIKHCSYTTQSENTVEQLQQILNTSLGVQRLRVLFQHQGNLTHNTGGSLETTSFTRMHAKDVCGL